MSATNTDYLVSPGLDRLWLAARAAWERSGNLTGNAVLHDLSETEALEISGLLGKRRPLRAHTTARLPLIDIDSALRAFAMPLTDWLEQSGGKLVDRQQERANTASAKTAMWNAIGERAISVRPDLQLIIEDFQRTGLPRRLAGNEEALLLEQTFDVLEAVLALERPCDIAVLAARHCGDAKALNSGNPIGTLVLRALTVLAEQASPRDEEGRRQLWERYRVVCNPLSSTVLTLNLRLEGDDFLAQSLALSGHAGEPRVITLRELAQTSAQMASSRRVHICENPTVVSAAAERSISCDIGLVCGEGWPSVAAHRLLRLAAASGAELVYHGDFDWHGLRIADSIISQYDARPWRMSAEDYLRFASTTPRTRSLDGVAHTASWDPNLAPEMSAANKTIEEEGAVLDQLLEDIAA